MEATTAAAGAWGRAAPERAERAAAAGPRRTGGSHSQRPRAEPEGRLPGEAAPVPTAGRARRAPLKWPQLHTPARG